MLDRRVEIEIQDYGKQYCISDRLDAHKLGRIADHRILETYSQRHDHAPIGVIISRIWVKRHSYRLLVMSQLNVNLHSFSGRETFGHSTLPLDSLLAEFNLPTQIVVGTIRVMMKETKGFDTRFDG